MELIDLTPYGLERAKRFKAFLEKIKEGEMPTCTGWTFTHEESIEIIRALNVLKEREDFDYKTWHRWFVHNLEFRMR